MAINLNVNGSVFPYPEEGDTQWGQSATQWAQAVTNGMLQKAGGSFPLTADVDFGGNFGLISSYFTARSNDPAESGTLRLSNTDLISYRNTANSGDLSLSVDSLDRLLFNGVILVSENYSNIVNANIASNAAITFSKMAAMGASKVPVTDGSGILVASVVTTTELGNLVGSTSSIQAQLNARLDKSGGTMTGSLLLAGSPSTSNEAATKQYVDNAMLGLSPKAAAAAATISPGNLSTDFENGDTLDGVTLSTGERILIKNQTDPKENGIYIVAASGAPSRSTDADLWSELVQAYVLVSGGTALGGSGWLCTAAPGGTIGVDPINFTQFSSSTVYTTDGEGIELTGTQFSLELDGSTLSKSGAGLRLNSTVVSDIANKLSNPLTTTGDMIYSSSGTTGARVAIGTAGQILTVSGGLPTWQTPTTNPTVVPISGNVNLTSGDSNKVFLVDCSSARTFQLPTPATGLNFTIKDASGLAATNNISLLRAASEQIEGVSATKILQTNWGSWKIITDGTNWFIIN